MKYPNFLNKNSLVGITALSSGCTKDKKDLENAINYLKTKYNIMLTPNIYGPDEKSSDKNTKIKELNYLLDNNINGLIISRGGDTILETLDSINYNKIVDNKILVTGYSDPTSLLYILTTKYDLATIYALNAKSYSDTGVYINNNIEILNGNLITQHSYYECISEDLISTGIIIGGCIECINDIYNTQYDNTINFIEKYKNYKIIFYFDIFNMTPNELKETLIKFNNSNYFKYTDLIIFSKVCYTNYTDIEYIQNIKEVLNNKKIIFNASLGHVKPIMTIINGSLVTIKVKNNKIELISEVINENTNK